MKKKTVFLVFVAVVMMSTSCQSFQRQMDDMFTYPTSPENIATQAKAWNSDAALVVDVADTQYVLYRRAKHNDGFRCYAMCYVKTDDEGGVSGQGGEFKLDEPEQPVVVTRKGNNALKLTVDSLVIAVSNIVMTDSIVTFNFGIDKPDRTATLYLYGKAVGTKDPFAETSIQQMISLSMMMEDLLENGENVSVEANLSLSSLIQAERELEKAERELDEAMETVDDAFDALTSNKFYAQYSRLDSLAGELGFTKRKAISSGDNHLKLEVSGGKGGRKDCYARMEAMAKAASESHCRSHRIDHYGCRLHKCKFTVVW